MQSPEARPLRHRSGNRSGFDRRSRSGRPAGRTAEVEQAGEASGYSLCPGFPNVPVFPSPEVKGYREDCTFVFDADDLFVVRSEHAEESGRSFEGRYFYDHQGERPIFRALTSTSVDPTPPKLLTRLEVTECRFGPIPESEVAPEPFLGRLQPGEITWKQVEEPSTAALLEWYWLAFVGGGISLAGGSGLALGSRYRDRRALRADSRVRGANTAA